MSPRPNYIQRAQALSKMADKSLSKMVDKSKEALRLKSLAEEKYATSCKSALKYARRAQRLSPNLDGISQMVATFQVLRNYKSSSSPDWYKVLQIDPFSPIATVRKQYKKLALVLHPDKNLSVGADDAFKAIGVAFGVLSDKARREQFDADLRAALRSCAKEAGIETFWTACSTCRLYHEFDRRHVGKRLVCPSCKKPFLAVDVGDRVVNSGDDDVENDDRKVRVKDRARARARVRVSSESRSKDRDKVRVSVSSERSRRSSATNRKGKFKSGYLDDDDEEWLAGSDDQDDEEEDFMEELVTESKKRKVMEPEKPLPKKLRSQREMTLAQMQQQLKQTMELKKLKKNKNKDEKVKTEEKSKEIVARNESLDLMPVEDPDFYDFDKDRVERRFKKGQIWAIYDDDDGMPRHYGLIDEVVSVNPFISKMNWLDLQCTGDEALICLEKLGFHISCGRFKVGRNIYVKSVNLFSHLVECERAARDIYRIYPKKGSVWALYSEGALDGEERSLKIRDKRYYDVAVCLTSYSEMHGLSMAYLDKVEGFKSIFRRREIGCLAIKWLEKDDFRLFSHQIPGRKLSGEESHELPKDCWELDPASLSSDMVRVSLIDTFEISSQEKS